MTLCVGGDADSAPSQWVGWNQTETPSVEVLLLLKSSHQFDRINLFYWADSAAGAGGPASVTFLDQYDAILAFSSEDISYGDKVKARSFSRDTAVLSSYLKVRMGYSGGAGALLLLTEIELVSRDGTNVLTGTPASISTSPTPAPPTTVTTATSPPATTATSATSLPATSPTSAATTASTSAATTASTSAATTASTSAATSAASSAVDTPTYTQPQSSTETSTIGIVEIITTTAAVATVDPSLRPSPETGGTDPTGTPEPVAPTLSELREELIVGLVFMIIIIIIIVLIAILIVSVFYYMRSLGKTPRDLYMGRGGQFKKLWNGDEESGTAGGLKSRIKSVSLLKRQRDPVYKPVNGFTTLDISGPVLEKLEAAETEEFSSTERADRIEDLNIYAPLSVSYRLAIPS